MATRESFTKFANSWAFSLSPGPAVSTTLQSNSANKPLIKSAYCAKERFVAEPPEPLCTKIHFLFAESPKLSCKKMR